MYLHWLSTDGCDAEGYHKNKAKRVRTTFTEEQLQVLQANFQLDSNPDGQDLERIAQITGLSKRVTQVWFQNSRARQKKHMHTGKVKTQSRYIGLRNKYLWRVLNVLWTFYSMYFTTSKLTLFSKRRNSRLVKYLAFACSCVMLFSNLAYVSISTMVFSGLI